MQLRLAIVTALVLLAGPLAHAKQPALLSIEVEAGDGVGIGGGGAGRLTMRMAPVTLTLLADYAIRTQPWVSVVGGLRGETLGRAGAGGVLGLRIRPAKGPLRIGVELNTILVPYTIAGPAGTIGACFRPTHRGWGLCGDLEITAYVLGTDLPPGRVVAQGALLVGVTFDAL
jgi:hypothetical protein